MAYLLIAAVSVILSALLTLGVRAVSLRFGIVDIPHGDRKIHSRPIPLLGGVAVYAACALAVLSYLAWIGEPSLLGRHVSSQTLGGIFLGGLILIIGGVLDDRYNLKPRYQIIAPICAIAVVIASGVSVREITNPLGGGVLSLAPFGEAITALWLAVTIYTTKFLDGLDGLVSGMTVIGTGIIGLLSLLFFVNIPTALLAFITAGAFAGFLLFNSHPASIFLGEAGSTFAGFMLGILSILSGAKFATALLILGIPILDAAWVIGRRLIAERRSPFQADRKHVHFRLLDAGLSHRGAVLLLYAVSATFGIAALFLQTQGKLVALALVFLLMILLALVLVRRERARGLTENR